LRDWLRDAVRRHLMSDVPLGVFLSGGLDSSALAAVAANLVDEPLRTFSVGFHEAEGNELPFAREVAAAIQSTHADVMVTPAQYFAALPHLIWQQDEPMAFSSGVPLYFVSRLAQQRQVKVVLTGEGADELFLGYNRYRVALWNQRFGRLYRAVTPGIARSAIKRGIDALPVALRRYPSRTFLAAASGGPRDEYFDNFSVFPARLRQAVLRDPSTAGDPYAIGLRCYRDAAGGPRDRMSATDLQTYLVELLMKQDRMSMAASIESRVPFLDDRLVAQVVALPAALKLRAWRTKAVLRDAVTALLPRSILTRPKMGFPVPLGRWLRGPYQPVVDEFVLGARSRARGYFREDALRRLVAEHREGAANHAERLWLLLTLEIWQRVCCDREAPADVMRPVWRRLGMRYASGVDQDGWTVAAQHWRPAPHVPDPVRAVRPALGHGDHDART
jgi:asparagine synthase (glutamine-hydrolysing)